MDNTYYTTVDGLTPVCEICYLKICRDIEWNQWKYKVNARTQREREQQQGKAKYTPVHISPRRIHVILLTVFCAIHLCNVKRGKLKYLDHSDLGWMIDWSAHKITY